MNRTGIAGLFATCVLAACTADVGTPETSVDMDQIAREYLFLELSMGLHDEAHVDAYFGPEEIRSQAADAKLSLADIDRRAAELADTLAGASIDPGRLAGLLQRLQALRTRIRMNQGATLPFDEESMLLFGAVAPDRDAAYYATILREIDALLPGEGNLPERVDAFRSSFDIPAEHLAAVFDAAIAECRKRTLARIQLPEGESFVLEYVTDKPWSGYNWYKGKSQSLIQINTDLPTNINRAVDLGCHEGYPGHHANNVLLEKNLVTGLDYAGNEAARDYLNGKMTREQAEQWLIDYQLSSAERASQRTRFFDAYRSYVINYNLGQDMVKQYVERDGADQDERWRRFEQLLSSPITTADLQ